MEGILVLAILYFVFKALAKKGGELLNGSRRPEGAAEETRDPSAQSSARPAATQRTQRTQPQSAQMRPAPRADRAPEGSVAYSVITPNVQVGRAQEPYSGSMGSLTQEGRASREGGASQEGMADNSPGKLRRSQETAAAALIPEDTLIQVLPPTLGANQLVQGFVMGEILGRPRKWSDHRG